MSHFSKIQTSLKDLDLLKKSLNDLSIHWEPELNKVRGHKDQTTFANLVIKQANNYDIGFSWNGVEYQVVADVALYSSINSYATTFPFAYPNIDLVSEIHPEHYEAHRNTYLDIKEIVDLAIVDNNIPYIHS
jgi:hypothetical protein